LNWRLIENSIGWSKKSWCHPLKEFIVNNPDIAFNHALEVGASEYGTLAPFISELSNQVTIGYFQCNETKLNKNLSDLNIKNYSYFVDMNKINDKYDLIIAKSIVGGIFRNKKSNINDVNEFIEGILEKNIKQDGMLILMDNGKSYFERYLSNFGARKNNWRFFNSKDFINPYQQYSFGFLSCFSLENRYGFFGKFFDYTLYFFDLFLSKLTNHPTVILTVYKKQ
jgi:hypothetical protein